MNDTPNGEVRNRADAPAVTVRTEDGARPLDDVLDDLGGGGAPSWDDITDKPSTYPPSSHTHSASQVTGLAAVATSGDYTDLSGTPAIPSSPGDIGAAPASHSHSGLMAGDAPDVPDSTAADIETVVNDLNAVIAALRARGVLA